MYKISFQYNETRIVMSWNPEPQDLDLHMIQVWTNFIFLKLIVTKNE